VAPCQVELGDFDLVDWWRRDEQDLGLVGEDMGMVDDLGQVILVPVNGYVLRGGG
jgi:hypothetical protein